jgi:hypothetical protein
MNDEIFAEIAKAGPALGSLTDAIGPLIAGLGGLGDALAVLAPEEMLLAAVAEALAPALESISSEINGALQPVLTALGNVVNALLMPVLKAVSALIAKLAPVLQWFALQLNVLAVALRVLLDPVGALRDAVTALGRALYDALSFLTSAITRAASILLQAFVHVGAALADFAKKVSADVLVPLAQGMAGALGECYRLTMTLGGANTLMQGFAGGLRSFASTLTDGVNSLVSAVTPFVQALNPNLVFGLNYAMKSLQATIGVALVPVAQVLTRAIREMAGILLSAMHAIGPALGSLTQALMTFVQGAVRAFADALIELAPLLDALAEAAHILVSAWDAIRAVLMAVVQSLKTWLTGLFGSEAGDLKGWLSAFRDGLHSAVEALLKFAVSLARLFGASGFQSNLAKSLRDLAGTGKQVSGTGAPPAPSDVGFKTFEDIGKTMAAAAFAAQGTGGGAAADKSEREWLAQMADSLDKMKDSGPQLADHIAKLEGWIKGAKDDLLGRVDTLKKEAEEEVDKIVNRQRRKFEEWLKEKVDQAALTIVNGFKSLNPFG